MIDDTADAIILRWPKAPQSLAPKVKPTLLQRLNWLALPFWVARLVAELLGWIAVLGFLTTWL